MGVAEATTFPSREDTSQMRFLHDLAKIHATFDNPNLVSRASLVPAMAMAVQGECPSQDAGDRRRDDRRGELHR